MHLPDNGAVTVDELALREVEQRVCRLPRLDADSIVGAALDVVD